jgi:hypothetical protein
MATVGSEQEDRRESLNIARRAQNHEQALRGPQLDAPVSPADLGEFIAIPGQDRGNRNATQFPPAPTRLASRCAICAGFSFHAPVI